jgi:hypothetical protein
MLAFLAWHRPSPGVAPAAYEGALERFHRSLAHMPPSGFRGSACLRVERVPWLDGGDPVGADGYEDWYLIEDWAALGVLEEAAVSHGHAGAHDVAAALTGMEAAAVYRLLEGSANPGRTTTATWVSSVPGHERPGLAQLLGDGIDPERDSLWQRCLVLGPAPEYCLHAGKAPMGVTPSRLPSGWSATTIAHETVWSG